MPSDLHCIINEVFPIVAEEQKKSPLSLVRTSASPAETKSSPKSTRSTGTCYIRIQLRALEEGQAPTEFQFDLVDGSEEDCFTLEPYEALLKSYTSLGKDFILARVITSDSSEQADKQFCSYYAAYHLNKVLFRTQPAEGLLHRMKARNPLNNMPVGDVHYYAVTHADFVVAALERPSALPSGKDGLLFTAKYIGCDDDFLMDASFREYFRRNAQSPDEAALFPINRADLQVAANEAVRQRRTQLNRRAGNLWGLCQPPATSEEPSVMRKVCFIALQFLMIAYIITGFVLIKFVFAPNFAFLIGFLLILLFLFTMLFLLDCEL